MDKLKIGILFGGCSEEHSVSVKSAQELAKNLDLKKYDPIYIGINQNGEWKLCDLPSPNWENGNCRPAILSPDRKTHGLVVLEEAAYKTVYLDVVFPVMHGKFGEDGAIQGLLELSNIPYVGCDIQSSVLCMDKSLAFIVLRNSGINTPMFWTIKKGDDIGDYDFPVFVKPARSGSSFGVNKVNKKAGLRKAIEEALQYDEKILIEEAIVGSEVGCAVLGNGTELFVAEVDQITVSHGFFRIHQEESPEQGSENSTIQVPANISPELRLKIQETTKKIYCTLGCKGLSRVDMFLKEDGQIIFNEVNTMPGLTSYSRFPKMMSSAALLFPELIDQVVTLALKREEKIYG